MKHPYRFFIVIIILSLMIAIPFSTRWAWLPLVARVLVSSDAPEPSDVIVILSGGIPMRNKKAANLYQQGFAPKIVTFGSDYDNHLFPLLGYRITSAKLNALVLTKYRHIPDSAIIAIEEPVEGTYDEAKALRRYIEKKESFKSIIIVTSGFHSKRAKWIFKKVFKGMNVHISAIEAPHQFFDANDWWLCEDGLITVFNEYMKFLYYFFKYD